MGDIKSNAQEQEDVSITDEKATENGLENECSGNPVAVEEVHTTDQDQRHDQDQEEPQSVAEGEGNNADLEVDALAQEFERLPLASEQEQTKVDDKNTTPASEALYDDPSDEGDDQGEWITPENVALHKSRALDLLPDSMNSENSKIKGKKGKAPQAGQVDVGCMTADYAMQNVLLHMGLNLVGVEGKRITSVKNWVLRCHACFK